MKKLLRFAALLLLLLAAFLQAAKLRDLSPSVSLRFQEPFTPEEAAPFAAYWSQEDTIASGHRAVLIRFQGDAQLVLPARWCYGAPPGALMENACAVSTRLAWELYGGLDATGLTVTLDGQERSIVGVFDHDEAVALLPGSGSFTAAELFPVPEGQDPCRWARDRAAQAGLEEPSQVLCGPEAAAIAMALPWLCVLLSAWPLVRRMGKAKIPFLLLAALLLASAVPDWLLPTRWTDTVFWQELSQSAASRIRDWLSLAPALRDIPCKQAWLLLAPSAGAALHLTAALIRGNRH